MLVDLDPQGNLTMSQGLNPDTIETSMFDVLVRKIPISDVIERREVDLAVASIDLAGAELALAALIGRERSLEKALVEVRDRYDFILIDTPPSLGLLTINAFVAATGVIVPVQCEYLALRGLVQLENTLAMVRENLNPRVGVEGIVPTMYDGRTLHAREAVEILEENFGDLVYKTRIRKTVRYAEAPGEGQLRARVRPDRHRGGGLSRAREGGAAWRGSARACVRGRSPSCSARPRPPSASRVTTSRPTSRLPPAAEADDQQTLIHGAAAGRTRGGRTASGSRRERGGARGDRRARPRLRRRSRPGRCDATRGRGRGTTVDPRAEPAL